MHSSNIHQYLIYNMMKYTLNICLILIIISCTTSSPVFDTDGEGVRAGVEYTMLAFSPTGFDAGGLSLARTPTRCPPNVVQAKADNPRSSGLPLIFYPINDEAVLRTSTDTNIKFNTSTNCPESTVWKIDIDGALGKLVVTTGGVVGNPSPGTETSWFKLEEVRDPGLGFGLYKLTFCPSICPDCEPICGDLHLLGNDLGSSERRLVLSSSADDPAFMVVIYKATDTPNLMIRNLYKPHPTS